MIRRYWIVVGVVLVLAVCAVDLWIYWTALPVFEDNRAGFERLAHARTLGLHLLAATLTGWIAYRVTHQDRVGVLAAMLFLVHPLAVPAVGYAQSLREMKVACGALGVACLVIEEGIAYQILGIIATLFVTQIKASAIGALGLVPAIYLVRHPDRTHLGISLAAVLLLGVFTQRADMELYVPLASVGQIGTQAAGVERLILQSFVPINIAFQYDAWNVPVAMKDIATAAMLFGLPILIWTLRRTRPLSAIGLACAFVLILPRLLIPTTHIESGVLRGPELIYAHQWYPALPGMVWILVDVLTDPTGERTS